MGPTLAVSGQQDKALLSYPESDYDLRGDSPTDYQQS
jgi:hypothetical protein